MWCVTPTAPTIPPRPPVSVTVDTMVTGRSVTAVTPHVPHAPALPTPSALPAAGQVVSTPMVDAPLAVPPDNMSIPAITVRPASPTAQYATQVIVAPPACLDTVPVCLLSTETS